MTLSSFFRLVKKKINKYDKYTKNPFGNSLPIPITIVWIENDKKEKYKKPDL